MSAAELSTQSSIGATNKVARALVLRSIEMRSSKKSIDNAAIFIEQAIASAPAGTVEIELPDRLATAAVLNWLDQMGLKVHDGKKLAIPSEADPYANCESYAEAIDEFDASTGKAASARSEQHSHTPAQPTRKRKLEEPGAPVAVRSSENAQKSTRPRRINFSEDSPDKDQAGPDLPQPDNEDKEPLDCDADSTFDHGDHQRKLAKWQERERQLEKELMEAIVSRDNAQDEDTRRIRDDKVAVARRNYRTAVKALEMAQETLSK